MKISPLAVVYNQETKTARINLFGVIGSFPWMDNPDPLTASKFLRALTNAEQNADLIDIYIHSPGGDVWDGIAICNAIKASKKFNNIHTYNAGICASMGAVILASSKNGNRHLAKTSLTMFHAASTGTWGNSFAHRETADQLDAHDHVLADTIADAFTKPVDDIKSEYFNGKDHWKTSKDLSDAGFADIQDFKTEEIPEDITDKSFDKIAAIFNIKPENIKTTNTNPDMSLFTNKLKKMHALAKVAAAAITAEQVEEINTEIAEAEIEGVTLVLDSELSETVAEAEKVPTLEASITAKETEISNLKTQVANLQKELKKPADDAGNPPPKGDDEQPEGDKPPVENYTTSVDDEIKRLRGEA